MFAILSERIRATERKNSFLLQALCTQEISILCTIPSAAWCVQMSFNNSPIHHCHMIFNQWVSSIPGHPTQTSCLRAGRVGSSRINNEKPDVHVGAEASCLMFVPSKSSVNLCTNTSGHPVTHYLVWKPSWIQTSLPSIPAACFWHMLETVFRPKYAAIPKPTTGKIKRMSIVTFKIAAWIPHFHTMTFLNPLEQTKLFLCRLFSLLCGKHGKTGKYFTFPLQMMWLILLSGSLLAEIDKVAPEWKVGSQRHVWWGEFLRCDPCSSTAPEMKFPKGLWNEVYSSNYGPFCSGARLMPSCIWRQHTSWAALIMQISFLFVLNFRPAVGVCTLIHSPARKSAPPPDPGST